MVNDKKQDKLEKMLDDTLPKEKVIDLGENWTYEETIEHGEKELEEEIEDALD